MHTNSLPQNTIAPPLLAWYHTHRRQLPFREDPQPYHVWVSEIMLQQTRMETVLPYYQRFLAALPTIPALAAAGEETLHKLWQGLGYYSRVRNMQKAAAQVVARHGGRLPRSYDELLALPGIGPYTAGAIASIAMGLPCVAVDGNVLRVFARLLNYDGDVLLPEGRNYLTAETARQQPQDAPGDYNQALMELGALVCLPGAPRCGDCPLAAQCLGKAAGRAGELPRRTPKKPKLHVPVLVLVVRRADGAVLLHRRPERGLLAGLWEPPTFEGEYTQKQAEEALHALLPAATLLKPLPAAKHIFTHRVWQLAPWLCTAPKGTPAPGGGHVFASAQSLEDAYPLPSAFSSLRPQMAGAPPFTKPSSNAP